MLPSLSPTCTASESVVGTFVEALEVGIDRELDVLALKRLCVDCSVAVGNRELVASSVASAYRVEFGYELRPGTTSDRSSNKESCACEASEVSTVVLVGTGRSVASRTCRSIGTSSL